MQPISIGTLVIFSDYWPIDMKCHPGNSDCTCTALQRPVSVSVLHLVHHYNQTINHIVHQCVLHQLELGMGVQFTVVKRDVWDGYLYGWWLCWTLCSMAFLLCCILCLYCLCCCSVQWLIDSIHSTWQCRLGSTNTLREVKYWTSTVQQHTNKTLTEQMSQICIFLTTIHITMMIPYPARHSGALWILMTTYTSLSLVDMLGYKSFNRYQYTGIL